MKGKPSCECMHGPAANLHSTQDVSMAATPEACMALAQITLARDSHGVPRLSQSALALGLHLSLSIPVPDHAQRAHVVARRVG